MSADGAGAQALLRAADLWLPGLSGREADAASLNADSASLDDDTVSLDAELRDPAIVMGAARADAAFPDATSACRAAMRELVRGRWTIDKLRFDLDAEGRGELLYRLSGAGREFHFFLISNKLPEAAKTDRNFAASWDAMGVLCQGAWTPEREAHLRREVPKQRAGMADYDTLIHARGNRSGRLFDHVVDCLAEGRQPDARRLAAIGYILRTTAFIGNGQCGTRPFDAYGPDHPFGKPYHAQFASAFMLREYVFDLVDHMARARSPRAVRLAPTIRRYLGLGNSAATGLVHYAANHPQQIHHWTLTRERVLARIGQCAVAPSDASVRQCLVLLNRACRYFEEGLREPDGAFCDPRVLVDDLAAIARTLVVYASGEAGPRGAPPWNWAELLGRLRSGVGEDAVEVLHAILLEVHPDIVEAASRHPWVDERYTLDPAMTVAELRALLDTRYDWALGPDVTGERDGCFWYRATDAPRDSRRGLRGRVPAFEVETMIDTPLLVRRLHDALEPIASDARVADIVRDRPDLRQVVARVQTLADMCYAELRVDWLSPRYRPFGTIRLVLALFGLEKFEAAFPKSVRGTFMQGAPIAEDVACGIDGDWPFPLVPEIGSDARGKDPLADMVLAPLPDCSATPTTVEVAPASAFHVAPNELERMVRMALQGHGMALGEAADAAAAALFAEARGLPAITAVLGYSAAGALRHRTLRRCDEAGRAIVFDAGGAPALTALPVARDAAEVAAELAPRGVGVVLVDYAQDAGLVVESVLRVAGRGRIGIVVWRAARADEKGRREDEAGRQVGVAAAGPGPAGPWYVEWSAPATEAAIAAGAATLRAISERLHRGRLAEVVVAAARAWEASAGGVAAGRGDWADRGADGFVIACAAANADESLQSFAALCDGTERSTPAFLAWDGGELRRRQSEWIHQGIRVPRASYDGLARAGAALLVPVAEQHRVLPAGTDPMKVF